MAEASASVKRGFQQAAMDEIHELGFFALCVDVVIALP
jgi:hypothetical protein